MINFVSNLPQNLRSGGFSGMNAAAFAAISKLSPVHYVGPINPPGYFAERLVSKFLRVAGSSGDFFYFSQRRLEAIARAVHAKCSRDAEFDFFHGFTPWILTKPARPYMAWSDCTFSDYIDIYHRRQEFRSRDLKRIERAEAAWLCNARRVFFTSDWAAKRAVQRYDLDAKRICVVGIFGEIEPPARDVFAGGKEFVFVSTNFEAKGGRIVLAAFQEVRKSHPNASLVVVGDQPSDASTQPGVRFTGYLRKEVAEQTSRLKSILGRARAVVHPTKSDISPLLLIEAGYFGCPVISSRRFAIPDLVDDRRTGLLLEDASRVDAVADAMSWMLENTEDYYQMREAAWFKARREHSKQQFEERLLSFVREVVTGEEMPAE